MTKTHKRKVLFLMNSIGEGSGPLQRAYFLSRRGYEVWVISFLGQINGHLNKQDYMKEFDNLRSKFNSDQLYICSIGASRLFDMSAYLKLFKILRKQSFDFVFAHHNIMGSFGVLISRIAGIKHVFRVELSDPRLRPFSQRILDLIALAISHAIVCISSSTMNGYSILEQKIFRRKMSVIYNGINLDDALRVSGSRFRKSYKIPKKTFILSYAARFHPIKNHKFLLNAFATLKLKIPNAVLVLAGRGVLRRKSEEQARMLGISDSVIFTDYLTRSELYDLLKDTDIYVMTSISEGFSEALLQAMASELPSVLTDIPAFREAIDDGVEGFLIQEGDVMGYVRACKELLENKSLRLRMGHAARKRAEKLYNIEKVVDIYEKIIEE